MRHLSRPRSVGLGGGCHLLGSPRDLHAQAAVRHQPNACAAILHAARQEQRHAVGSGLIGSELSREEKTWTFSMKMATPSMGSSHSGPATVQSWKPEMMLPSMPRILSFTSESCAAGASNARMSSSGSLRGERRKSAGGRSCTGERWCRVAHQFGFCWNPGMLLSRMLGPTCLCRASPPARQRAQTAVHPARKADQGAQVEQPCARQHVGRSRHLGPRAQTLLQWSAQPSALKHSCNPSTRLLVWGETAFPATCSAYAVFIASPFCTMYARICQHSATERLQACFPSAHM